MKKVWKRVLPLLLVISLLAMTVTVAAANDDKLTVTIEKATKEDGKYIVPVSISNIDEKGIGSLGCVVEYDTLALTLTAVETSRDGVQGGIASGMPAINVPQNKIGWISTASMKDGTMFWLVFEPKEPVINNYYSVTISASGKTMFSTAEMPSVQISDDNVEIVSGIIEVTGGMDYEDLVPAVTISGDTNYVYGDAATVLTAKAEVGYEGNLNFRWYERQDQVDSFVFEGQCYTPPLNEFGSKQYSCWVFNTLEDGRYFEGRSELITVTYSKKSLEGMKLIVDPSSTTYSGKEKTVEAFIDDVDVGEYTVSGATAGPNIGTYTVTAKAKEDGHYTGSTSAPWEITPATLTGIGSTSMTVYTNGQTYPIPFAAEPVDGGTVTYNYQVTDGNDLIILNGDSVTAKGTGTGEAKIKVTATCENHTPLTETITVHVADKKDASSYIAFTAKTVSTTYTGGDVFASDLFQEATCTLTDGTITYFFEDEPHRSLSEISFRNAGTYTVTAVYEDDAHYGAVSATVTIAKKTIDVGGYGWNDTSAYAYDGTEKSVALTGVDADEVEVAYSGTTRATDAGTYTATAVLTAKDAENYQLVGERTKTLTWTINPKPVTVSGITANDKTYDGGTDAKLVVSQAAIEGKITDDDLTVASATGAFANKSVGTDKPVTINGITLGGTDAANYTLAESGSQTTATASITAREVTVSGITAKDKVYDGSTNAELDYSAATFDGKVDGDILTVTSAAGTFSDKNVGTDQTVTVTNITLGGADAGNYTLTGNSATATAGITAKTLEHVSVSGVTVTKVYDGTTNAGTVSGNVTFDGKVGDDDVSITATAGAYADKNVGTGKTVTLSLALAGNDAGNYTLQDTAAAIETAVITACSTFADVTAATQNAVVGVGAFTAPAFTGIGGEAVTGTTAYTYKGASETYEGIVNALKNLTKGETAFIGYTFTASGNYTGTKTGTIAVTMVDILFTVGGQPATSENAVTVKTNPVYGDSWSEIVTIKNDDISATLSGQPVAGTYSLVTDQAAPDAGAQQYTVLFTADGKTYDVCTGTVTIAQKALTITGVGAADKVYDGTTAATATGTASLSGLVPGDNVTVKAGTAEFAGKNAGTQTVTFTGYGIEGPDAANYTVSQPADVTATISRKSVTITGVAVADKTYDGTTAATVTAAGTVDGKIDGDDVTVQAGAAQFAGADVGENIAVTFSGFTLSGDDAGNYILSGQPANGQADITKANYSGTPVVNINVMTNQATATEGSLTASDFFTTLPAGARIERVTGTDNDVMDTVAALDGTITYTSGTNLTTAGQTATYTVTISAKNYNDIAATLTFTTVDKTPVTVSGVAVADKTYDGKALTYTGTPAAMTADGETIQVSSFTYTWKDSDGRILTAAPKNAGAYTLTVAVEDSRYTGSVTLNCTIAKATVAITALDVSAAVGSKLPTFTYRVAGLAQGESLKTEPTLTCAADMNKVGTYVIKASGAQVPDGGNYNDVITYLDGKLTVYYYSETRSVTVYGGAHGIARVDDYNPETGDRVTITVTPDAGYEVDEVLVTTASGKKVSVTRTGENRYVFEMPKERVSVQVTYKAEEEVVYTDVSPYAWYAEAVNYVTDQGLMNGVGEGTFGPDVTVTRAMVWTVLARMDGENTEGGSTWYAIARRWAMENGVSDGTNPEAAITREQLAAMLYRYCGSPTVSGTLRGYDDGSSVSDWAEEAMVWAIGEGLIEGVGSNKLAPTADTTRAQLAQILMRFDKTF